MPDTRTAGCLSQKGKSNTQMALSLTGEKQPATPRVLNKHRDGVPPGAVYVGRPSKWGNPFIIGKHGNRAEVIARYRQWVCNQPHLMAALPELRGRDLVCFCAPAACHGDVLMELANAGQ